MLQILAATSNMHKVEEFRAAFQPVGEQLQIITCKDLPPFSFPEETGRTFEENAMIKAVSASAFADIPAFADDSGLEVEALNGAPGIYSARYAGENATDADRIAKLLQALKDQPNRRARFVCVIALAARGKAIRTFCGEVKGQIQLQPRGNHGFGYDPVFVPDGYGQSFGELDAAIKNRISHRADALKKLVGFLQTELASADTFDFE